MKRGRSLLALAAVVGCVFLAVWAGDTSVDAGGLSPQGGTITSVAAGSGLTGGGSGGPVTISANFQLIQHTPINACIAGSAINALGSDGTLTCIAAGGSGGGGSGGGTVTNITTTAPISGGPINTSGAISLLTGTGLTLSGSNLIADIATGLTLSGNHVTADLGTGVTLSGNHIIADISTGLTLSGNHIIVDSTVVQTRVSGSCTAPQSIRVVNSVGTVTCTTASATTSVGTANFMSKYSTASNFTPSLWFDDGTNTNYNSIFTIAAATGNVTDPGVFAIGQTLIAVPSAGSGLVVTDTGSAQAASHDLAEVIATGSVNNGTSLIYRGVHIVLSEVIGGGSGATATHIGLDVDTSGITTSGSATPGPIIGVRANAPSAKAAFEATTGDVNVDTGNVNAFSGNGNFSEVFATSGVFATGLFDGGNRAFSIAGTGIRSSGATASIDTSVVQETSSALVTGCGAGSALGAISQAGAPTCVATGGLSGGTANLLTAWSSSTGVVPTVTTDDTTTTGTCNDYALPANTLVLRSNCSTLTGVTGGVEGRLLLVENESATTNLTISNEAAGSTTAGDRFTMSSSSNWVLNNNTRAYAMFVYNGSAARWQQFTMSPGNGTTAPGTQTFTNVSATTQVSAPTVTASSVLSLTGTGHYKATGTAPALTSCGTSPTVTGADPGGTVVEGSTATGCTVTFAATYTTAPTCAVTPRGVQAAFTYSTSATALTVTNTSAETFDYVCVGH